MVIDVNCEKKRYEKEIDYKRLCRHLILYYKKRLSCTHTYDHIVINYNLISGKKQREINELYLNHNYNTDIITFNLSTNSNTLTGDIYISRKKVFKNGKKYGEGFYKEMNRNFIHGFLHLLGYDDKTKMEKKIIRREEDKYLQFIEKRFHVEQPRY